MSGGTLVQEKGKEDEYKFYPMYFSNYNLSYEVTKFPLCSEDAIVFALTPTYDQSDYTKQFQNLLITPPMNSHSVKQRTVDEEYDHELFLHYDDKYILFLQSDRINSPSLKWLKLNGNEIQKIKFKAFEKMKRPVFSQSGEFMLCAQTTETVTEDRNGDTQFLIDVLFKVYRIAKGKDYKEEVKDEPENAYDPYNHNNKIEEDQNQELFELELFHEFIVTDEFLDERDKRENSPFFNSIKKTSERKQVIHVDNKGNYLFLSPERSIFLLNDKNVYDQFQKYWSKSNLGQFDDFEMIKFGQGYIIIKLKEIIYQITYDGTKWSLTGGREIRHKALDLPGECDLEHIVPTRMSQYVNFFYKLGESITIVVWDLEEDIEYSHFSSREGDIFMDYITGNKSELGIVCFDKYIVDLDNGIPNPFVSKKKPSNEKYWWQGLKINSAEDMLLSLGTIETSLCKSDIQYSSDRSYYSLDFRKVWYYLGKKSVAFNCLNDHEQLSKILKVFESEPLYYSMLILENDEGKTPLGIAIDNNAAKVIEVILNYLIELQHFSLSRIIYK